MIPSVVILDHVAGAREARGLVVVIDVFRAFTVACHVVAAGAARLHPLTDPRRALALCAEHAGWLAIGERHGRRLPGFDFGNSPSEICSADLNGRTVVHTTHAGTEGLMHAGLADEVLTGSLVNAAAICRYIRRRQPNQVSLVRMGQEARERCAEDDLCADIIAARLAGDSPDAAALAAELRYAPSARRFLDPEADWAPEADLGYCIDVDRFDFVLRLEDRDGELPWLARIDV
ncbi:MAG: 2-phosphosulfolactate phosphatase [Steroidobacteraceae bacterium]